MNARTKLIGNDGYLATPDGEPVILIYPEGDCDSFDWPLQRGDEVEICGNLARALYDMRESGQISNADGVTLPDGTEFDIGYWMKDYRNAPSPEQPVFRRDFDNGSE
jgi:hypothetical protein